jgi:hypothetical protein
MALTDAQIAKVYVMLGVPRKTTVFGAHVLAAFKGPGGEIYDLTEIKSQIDSAITALTSDEEALFTQSDGILDEFDEYWLNAEKITSAAGAQGIVFDAERQMEKLRQRTSDIIGVYVPRGGFKKQWERLTRGGGNRVVR